MVASTAFYGTIGTIREFGSIIIDIDKKMTDLKKVMSEDTDFDKIFDQATASAETFGKTISETMDSYVMFAKQGFKGQELETLSNSALVGANVGDIEAGKMAEYMTASLLQWNKDSSEAMSIVDSWNELSNNFSTTVENLAQGQAKAGATARALGMDFDQLNAVVGTLNARTKQSGNEIGNFVKSTFANIVSNKGRSVLSDLGVQLENEDGSLRDIMDIYKDVAKEYVKLNQADKNSVTLGLAGKYHISRMQTLLDDLGSAKSMYDEMYESSTNSANSAMNENQTYLKSLEARINLARVEIEKLALAIGEAFMSESMVAGLQLFSSILTMLTKIVDTVGALPVILFTVVTALTLMSNRFNDILKKAPSMKNTFSSIKDRFLSDANDTSSNRDDRSNRDIDINTESTDKNTKATDKNTDSKNKNAESSKKGAKALSLFTAGFGLWGIGAVGVGLTLEWLLGKMAKARQEQEALRDAQEQDIAMFKSNEEAIGELGERYKELSAIDHEPDSQGYAELLEVQNELAKLLPSLKTGEDAYGNAILQSSTIVTGRIDLLKEQVRLEKELADAKASQENEETVKQAKEDYETQKDNVDDGLKKAEKTLLNQTFFYAAKKAGAFKSEVKDAEDLIQTINIIDTKLKDQNFVSTLSKMDLDSLKVLRKELTGTFDEVQQASLEMDNNLNIVRSSMEKELNDILQYTEGMSDGAVNSFKNISSSALALASSTDDFDTLKNVFSGIQINENMKTAFEDYDTLLNRMKADTTTDLDVVNKTYGTAFTDIRKEILNTLNLEPNSQAYKAVVEAMDNAETSAKDYQIQLAKVAKEKNLTAEEAKAFVDSIEGATGAIDEEVDSLGDLKTAIEKVVGVSTAQTEKVDDLIFIYSELSTRTNLSAEENATLSETINTLNKLYPHLTRNGEIRIDKIGLENDAVKALHEAYELSKDGILTAEEKHTVDLANETLKRLDILRKEAEAVSKIQEQFLKNKTMTEQEISDLIEKEALPNTGSSGHLPGTSFGKGMNFDSVSEHFDGFLDNTYSEITDIMDEIASGTSKVNDVVATATEREKDRADATKESAKEVSLLEKINNKYALSMEKLNTALEKVQSKQKKYVTHSKQYRDAILEENKIIQQQISLNEQKAKELQTIPKTSTSTSTSDNSNATTTESTVRPKGWSGNITSKYGMRDGSMHNGIDVDGAIGDTLQSNVNGVVEKAGEASKIGEHWSYGNLVIIKDKDNKRHYYAHMDDVSVVEGQQISAGANLGTIGNSGNVIKGKSGDGSHLHYGVKDGNKWLDPASYVQTARNGVKSYSSTSSSSSPSSDNNDYENSLKEIESLKQENNSLYDKLQENQYKIVESNIAEYAYNVSLQDNVISKQESLQKNMLEHNLEYEKSVKKQFDAEKNKLKLYQNEYDYVQKIIASGELNNAQQNELINRRNELQQIMIDSEQQTKEYYNEVIGSYLAKFDNRMDDYTKTLEWEQVKIQSVSRENERYNKTLEIMKKARQGQVNVIKEELSYVDRMLSKGNLSSEMYEELTQRANSLKNELIETTMAIQDLNYEMIQTKVVTADERIDDIDFKISRSQSIRSRYDEDSGDYYKELGYEIEQLEEKLVELEGKETHLRDSLSNPTDLGHQELQDLEEQLEDTSQAYQDTKTAILQAKKAKSEFDKEINEEIKELRESLADDIIDALKDAIEELRDIQIDAIEDLIDAEEERHEKAMKQLDDELDRYNDIIDAKRREIDDEDRDRTHGNNIEELTQRKTELQSQINLLSSSNVYADIKEREGLQKELAEVEKQIEDENYQYNKELREQNLDDLLKAKEDSIEEQQKLEERNSEKTIKALDRQKEYWDKYYDDLLNDESEFQRIRNEILAGNHDIVETKFNDHIGVLKNSLSSLGISFDSMTSITGEKIQENVLSKLSYMREEISKVSKEIDKILDKKNTVTGDYGSSYDFDDSILDNSKRDKNDDLPSKSQFLTEGNLKVILAKFMNEQIAGSLNPNTDKTRIQNIRDKADKLAEEGREQGATVMSTESLKGILDRLDTNELKQVGDYFQNNASASGFQTQDYVKYIEEFGSTVSQGSVMTTGDKQVMFAKYLKEQLVPKVKESGDRSAINETANKIAQNGRSNTSLIKSDVGYTQSLDRLSNSQLGELGDFFLKNAGVIGNSTYRQLLEQYATGNLIPKKNTPASLDTGGYTGNFGSTGGADGKGGKFAILHQRELVLDPLDTERMFKISAIMDNIMKAISSAVTIPTLPKINNTGAPTSNDNSTIVNINIDKFSGTKSDIDSLSKQISNKLLREKGKR